MNFFIRHPELWQHFYCEDHGSFWVTGDTVALLPVIASFPSCEAACLPIDLESEE
jgi:hypothetical protein